MKLASLLALLAGLALAGVYFSTRSSERNYALSFCPADATRYQFTYSAGGTTSGDLMAAAGIGAQDTSLDVTGDFTLSCLDQGSYWLTFDSFNKVVSGLLAQDSSLKGVRVNFSRTPEGVIEEVKIPTALSPMDKHIVRDFLEHLSFKFDADLDSWETIEADKIGEYTASYERDGYSFTKNRSSYPAEKGSDNARTIEVTTGKSSYSFSDTGLTLVDSHIELEFSLKGETVAQSYSKLLAAKTTTGPAIAKVAAQRPAGYESLEVTHDAISKDLFRKLEQNELGKHDFESIAALLEAAGPNDLTSVYLKFKALLTLEPAEASKVRDLLLEENVLTSKFHLLTSVLSQVGSVEAQNALQDALTSHPDRDARIAIIGELGVTAEPTLQTESVIRQFREASNDSDEIQVCSLALGNIAKSVKDSSPDRYAVIEQNSLSRLDDCSDFGSCVNALHVLGNVGSTEVLTDAQRFLKDPNETVRSVAVSSLRFVESPQVEPLLLSLTLTDPVGSVRSAAAYEMKFREISDQTVTRLLRQMEVEPSEAVRLKIIGSIASQVHKEQSWIEKVQIISEVDRAESVRDASDTILKNI